MGVAWALLLGGLFLVCLASPFSQAIMLRHGSAFVDLGLSFDGANGAAALTHTLGLMAFAAGLVERLITGLRYGRRTAEDERP